MDIEVLKNNVNMMLGNGTISVDVIQMLIKDNGQMVPTECTLWDYKLTFDDTKKGWAKTLKSIVSFYNTYGGYIIYGINETEKDTTFVPVGITPKLIDQQKLSGHFDKYFGQRIELVYKEIEFIIHGESQLFGLLYIPKRPTDKVSLSSILDASDEKGKLILSRFVQYFRASDECKQVTSTEDFEFISSDRDYNPSIKDINKRRRVIDHNLPDKSFICSEFIGRFTILEELWAWLSDEFQYAKVLAADGGKGKTSIAYEFCQLLIRSRLAPIEQVVWLTAKKKQFKAFYNEYLDTPETHYADLYTLLEQICLKTGSLSEELDDCSIQQLTRIAKKNLESYPSFIVIDDVDSNDPSEQKRILETARIISNSQSRVLITTRINNIYSIDSSITIAGMQGQEYIELVETMSDRFKTAKLNHKNIRKLERISEGSPLFTESILRLLKRGSSVEAALCEWENKSGEAAREAALRKEVDELSLEATKILITVSSVGSCSKTELHQLTDMENSEIEDALIELDQLFLLNSIPFIESEPRFESSSTISNLTLSIMDELLPDANSFIKQIEKVFHGLQANLKTHLPLVAKAISQCNALINEKRFADAESTLLKLIQDPAYKENKDLHFMAAKIQYDNPSCENSTTEKLFEIAYIKGQRKEAFFDMWYELSLEHGKKSITLDVCRYAIKSKGRASIRWCDRLAESCQKQSEIVTNPQRKLELLVEAYDALSSSRLNRPSRSWGEFKDKCHNLIDPICALSDQVDDINTKAKIVLTALESGDISSSICQKLIHVSIQARDNENHKIKEKIKENIFVTLDLTINQLKAQDTPREALIAELKREQLACTISA